MYDLVGYLSNINVSYQSRKPILVFEMEDKRSALEAAENLLGKKVSVKVGKYRKKRSLDANAYCWTLISKIAEKTNVSTEEVYSHTANYSSFITVGATIGRPCVHIKFDVIHPSPTMFAQHRLSLRESSRNSG